MRRVAIAVGAVGLTAALAPMLPSSAYGATGHFDYVSRGGHQQSLANPATDHCNNVQGGGSGTPAYNATDAHAQLFDNTTCQGKPFLIMNPGERSGRGGVPAFGSVNFVV